MTTVQFRTDEKTKKSVRQILEKLGLDLSTAMNMYLMQIIVTKGIPFRIVTENGFTPEEEEKILKEAEWAKKHGKVYRSARELHEAILKE